MKKLVFSKRVIGIISVSVLLLLVGITSTLFYIAARPQEVAPFKSTAIVEDNPVCPFNAINVGDGICDEEPNIEECAFDGGDCCLQYKLAPLCRDNCDCNMTVDPDFIDRMLQETNVYIFDNDISDMEILDSYSVEDVVSIEVCSMICLNSNRSLTVNSWTYNEANRKCSCEWLLRSENCVEEYPEGLKKVSELSVGKQSPESRFLMLSKILKCDCMYKNVSIDESSKVSKLYRKTSWHCWQSCNGYDGCEYFSFTSEETHGGKNCLLDNGDVKNVIFRQKDDWITGSISGIQDSSECLDIKVISTSEQPTTTYPSTEPQLIADLLLVTTGWNGYVFANDTETFSLPNVTKIECLNHLQSAEHLDYAVGGAILDPNSNNNKYLPVVCGGLSVFDNPHERKIGYKHCQILGEEQNINDTDKMLHHFRRDSASVVLDYGTTLWITGGDYAETPGTTEFFNGSATSRGPYLPEYRNDHCLELVSDPSLVILFGGQDGKGMRRYEAWFIDLSTLTWIPIESMHLARAGHACGIVRDSGNPSWKIVIAAGGWIIWNGVEYNGITDTVELLGIQHRAFSKWRFGPELPVSIARAASVTTPDKSRMFLIGGQKTTGNFYDLSSHIYQFQCWNLVCQWTKLEQELQNGRSGAIAMVLPEYLCMLK